MLLHWATRFGCHGAQLAARAFRDDPDTDSHRLMASLIFKRPQSMVTDAQRKKAKTIFLGLCYGMGSGKLAASLGLPTQRVSGGFDIAGPEAMKLLNAFHEGVPYVRELDRTCQRQAKEHGFIRTLSGRLCRFPLDDTGKYDWVRTALNRLVQGSAADQTKRAMVDAWNEGLHLQLQIHDEICLSAGDREEGRLLTKVMEAATPLVIPTRCDVEFGPNWAAARPVDTGPVACEGDFWDDAVPTPEAEASEEFF